MNSKAILMALLAFAFGGVEAASVSRENAGNAVRAWVARGKTLGARLGRSVEKIAAHETAAGTAYYAVKMSGGGTVFVSADDRQVPVIAFTSATNDFSTLSADHPLRALLNGRSAARTATTNLFEKARVMGGSEVAAGVVSGAGSAANVTLWAELIAEGASLTAAEKPSSPTEMKLKAAPAIAEGELGDVRVAPLVQSKWSQASANGNACWNYYTPNGADPKAFQPGDPANAVCGCVATAMSQVMRYHRYPTQMVPMVSRKCFFGNAELTLTMQAGAYDWEKMTLCPEGDGEAMSEENYKAIGKLTSDAGITVYMQYTLKGSGAYSFDVSTALMDIWQYGNAVFFDSRFIDQTTGSSERSLAFQKALYANFDAGYPVVMGIPGHEIVADGYGYNNGYDYVHLNLGWAGSHDCWYNLPDVTEAGSAFDSVDDMTYNVFPDKALKGQAVLSGRTFAQTADGKKPVVNATVRIYKANVRELVKEIKTPATGVWGVVLPEGRYDVVGVSEDGLAIAERNNVNLQAPKTTSVNYNDLGRLTPTVWTVGDVGNSWGNDLELTQPAVHVRSSLGVESTLSLVKAFEIGAEVANEGVEPMIEICRPVDLPSAWTLGYSCTICCTNDENPAALAVAAKAPLTVATLSRVVFSNVVFSGSSPALRVNGGGTAALAGNVRLDRIVLEDDGELELAGPLDPNSVYRVRAEARSAIGEAFGRATVDLETARKFANHFINEIESELVGEAVDDGHGGVLLKWALGDIPDAAAVARLEQDGVSLKFADLKVLAKYVTNDAEIVILTNCQFEGVFATSNRTIAIRSENGATVTPKGGDETVRTMAALVVNDGGTLSLSNVVFSGFSQFGGAEAFVVVDEGGSFRMLEGAEIRKVSNTSDQGLIGCGAVLVRGEMAMTNGARIVSCVAEGGEGGGVCVESTGALCLCGGEISGCRATECGGGVYLSVGAKMSISGEARVTDNRQQGEYAATSLVDDIYVYDIKGDEIIIPLTVTNVRRGAKIGLRLHSDENKERDDVLGKRFARLEGTLDGETAAAVFYSNVHDAYYTGLVGGVSESGDALVWAAKAMKKDTVPEDEATVRVVIGGETNFYARLQPAFTSVQAGDVAMIALLTNVVMDADISVSGEVTLVGADSRWKTIFQRGGLERGDANFRFDVTGGGNALVLTNVVVTGERRDGAHSSYGTLFNVTKLGHLTLQDGAEIVSVCESNDYYWPWEDSIRSSAAVIVEADGRLTMESGSRISSCTNDPDPDNEAVAGGVMVTGTNAVFHLAGGEISGCNASYGGGIVIENGAKLIVSGDADVSANKPDNLNVDADTKIVLAGLFTGKIGHKLGATIATTETNVFGTVAADCPLPLVELVPSATNFYKEADHEVTGRIVTNATEALLVWSSAVTDDGVFTDKDGNRYGAVTGSAPVPPPPVSVDPVAFKSITRISETEWQLVVTNRKTRCRYALAYTDDLKKGFVTTGEWETATADGPWTTNVIFKAEELRPTFFWKALGRDAEIPAPPNP